MPNDKNRPKVLTQHHYHTNTVQVRDTAWEAQVKSDADKRITAAEERVKKAEETKEAARDEASAAKMREYQANYDK